jgi:hypothetical protein
VAMRGLYAFDVSGFVKILVLRFLVLSFCAKAWVQIKSEQMNISDVKAFNIKIL